MSEEIDAAFQKIVSQNAGISLEEVPLEQQQRVLSKYSMGALTFGPIYFRIMKDREFFWLSLIGGIFPPILLVLPFFARRRAWNKGKWVNFALFEQKQRQWDRAGWYGLVVLLLLSYLVIHVVLGYLTSLLGTNGTNLQDLQQQLQDLQAM